MLIFFSPATNLCAQKKNGFAEMFKNLARCRFEKNLACIASLTKSIISFLSTKCRNLNHCFIVIIEEDLNYGLKRIIIINM